MLSINLFCDKFEFKRLGRRSRTDINELSLSSNHQDNYGVEPKSKDGLRNSATEKPKANKKGMINHLNNAKSILEGVTAASGIVTALNKVIQLAVGLF